MWPYQLVLEFRYRVEFRRPQSWDIECPYEEPTLLMTSFFTLLKGLQIGQNVQLAEKKRTFELNSKFHKTYKYFFYSLITI
jgi:hypothetical protein